MLTLMSGCLNIKGGIVYTQRGEQKTTNAKEDIPYQYNLIDAANGLKKIATLQNVGEFITQLKAYHDAHAYCAVYAAAAKKGMNSSSDWSTGLKVSGGIGLIGSFVISIAGAYSAGSAQSRIDNMGMADDLMRASSDARTAQITAYVSAATTLAGGMLSLITDAAGPSKARESFESLRSNILNHLSKANGNMYQLDGLLQAYGSADRNDSKSERADSKDRTEKEKQKSSALALLKQGRDELEECKKDVNGKTSLRWDDESITLFMNELKAETDEKIARIISRPICNHYRNLANKASKTSDKKAGQPCEICDNSKEACRRAQEGKLLELIKILREKDIGDDGQGIDIADLDTGVLVEKPVKQ